MGTSDANLGNFENQGLIPRFIFDLFENLNISTEEEKVDATVIQIFD